MPASDLHATAAGKSAAAAAGHAASEEELAVSKIMADKGATAASSGFERESPYTNPLWFFSLFFGPKFWAHRVLGLLYLIQYSLAFRLYVVDYPAFSQSPLLWTLPISGVVQAVTATYYFYFLPKSKADPGYYSDKSVLTFNFVVRAGLGGSL